jgi:hypothetical protein
MQQKLISNYLSPPAMWVSGRNRPKSRWEKRNLCDERHSIGLPMSCATTRIDE